MRLVHERRLEKFVHIGGLLSRYEIARILGRSAVFAFPSLKEGMPVAVLEAMACGVPVVGSDVSGVNDLVEDCVNGLLVPPRDSMLLAKAILSLLMNDGLRSRISVNARRTIVEGYSWDTVIKKLDAIYNTAN